jgi:regulator of RNase E activity RraA
LTTRILGLEGQINVPVAVGGVVAMPGDVVFGDGDGLCILPRADAARLSSMVARLDADPVVRSLRDTVAKGTPLGKITGAAGYFEEAAS